MMKYWDAAKERPVPDVWVDCGKRFGTVPAPLTAEPDCVDPEPALWREDEERRQESMRARRDEVRQSQVKPRPNAGFVDVDDMKEEKVEVKFDDIPAIVPPPGKKKKKRKLL